MARVPERYADLWEIEPTCEQIENGFAGTLDDGSKYLALWYPQMGGYVAKCWIRASCWSGPHPSDGLHAGPPGFDAFIFHDGDFPFAEGRRAIRLHHCSAKQFIEFGEKALAFLRAQVQIRE